MGPQSAHTGYRIVVRGEVGQHFVDVFDGLAVATAGDRSTLVGPVRDQAELQGMLDLLVGLGHEIVSVRRED